MQSRSYRRARKDYPKGIVAIYDNGGKTLDRYTVVYEPRLQEGMSVFPYVGMSASPLHPQCGVFQHGETVGYRPNTRDSGVGRVIAFEELPTDCQKALRLDLGENLPILDHGGESHGTAQNAEECAECRRVMNDPNY